LGVSDVGSGEVRMKCNTMMSRFRAASRMPNRNKAAPKLKCHLCWLTRSLTKPGWPAVDSLELLGSFCGLCSCEGNP
jgi:hypothetical protein